MVTDQLAGLKLPLWKYFRGTLNVAKNKTHKKTVTHKHLHLELEYTDTTYLIVFE